MSGRVVPLSLTKAVGKSGEVVVGEILEVVAVVAMSRWVTFPQLIGPQSGVLKALGSYAGFALPICETIKHMGLGQRKAHNQHC